MVAKELLRDVYAAVDERHARRRLIVFFQYCADAEVTRLARTIDRWRDEILAYHCTGRASNGRVEIVHMLTEKIRRNSHCFSNITNYRRRIFGSPSGSVGHVRPGRGGQWPPRLPSPPQNPRLSTTLHRVEPLSG